MSELAAQADRYLAELARRGNSEHTEICRRTQTALMEWMAANV
jgi:hypothetical protein